MNLPLFPSQPLAVPLRSSPSAALTYLETVLDEQPSFQDSWLTERNRLTGTVTSQRILLRLGDRHRWVVFVGRFGDNGQSIQGVFKLSLPERFLFSVWYVLLAAIAISGVVTSLQINGLTVEVCRLFAIALAMLLLGFFATRISWMSRKSHVSWIAGLIRRAARHYTTPPSTAC